MTIYLGADHRGFAAKELLKKSLLDRGHTVIDCGNEMLDPADDYPIFALAVAEQLRQAHQQDKNAAARGIVLCGSGVGATIAANKVDGVRCGLGFDVKQVEAARADDDINVLAIATDFSHPDYVQKLVDAFLNTTFAGTERGVRRIQQISKIENI